MRAVSRLKHLTALCIVSAIGLSCKNAKQENRGDVDNLNEPISLTSVELSYECKLEEGQSIMPGGSPIRITVVQIDDKRQACLFSIEHTSKHTKRSGWISVGADADFARQEVGKRGLRLAAIEEGKAIVQIQGGYTSRTVDDKGAKSN